MKNRTKLVALGTVLILSGVLAATIIPSTQVFAQEPKIDVGKLKQILNETRNAIQANDDPGALTQLDMADQLLSGNITSGTNATGTEAVVTG